MPNFEFKPSTNPAYSDDVRDRVENSFGIRFPKTYIDLMKRWNGGYLGDTFQIPVKEPPDSLHYHLGAGFFSISDIGGLTEDARSLGSILYTVTTARNWGVPKEVIPFSGDGHTWIAFDYRHLVNDEPTIIFIETDKLWFRVLANSFQELLDSLLPHDQVFDEDGEIIYTR